MRVRRSDSSFPHYDGASSMIISTPEVLPRTAKCMGQLKEPPLITVKDFVSCYTIISMIISLQFSQLDEHCKLCTLISTYFDPEIFKAIYCLWLLSRWNPWICLGTSLMVALAYGYWKSYMQMLVMVIWINMFISIPWGKIACRRCSSGGYPFQGWFDYARWRFLVSHDYDSKLNILSIHHEANGWNSPEMAKLLEWVSSNDLKLLWSLVIVWG